MTAVRLGVVAAIAVATLGTAAAAPPEAAAPAGPTVVILRLDATPGVDAGLIDRVQHEVEDRAQRSGLAVTSGAANLADTAALAGCTSKVAADCHDQILETLGADELVYGTVDRSMAGHRVTVARVRRGGAPVEVVIDVPAGNLDTATKAIQPGLDKLFPELAATGSGAGGEGTGTGTGGEGTGSGTGTGTGTGDGTGSGAGTGAGTGTGGEIAGARTEGGPIDKRKAILIGGVSVGAALFVIGVLQWNEASSLQDDIDAAPDQTPSDVQALLALEDRAQSHATQGNWFVLAGLAVGGGTAAWWYFTRDKDRPTPTSATRLQPWVSPTGGGVTLSWSTP